VTDFAAERERMVRHQLAARGIRDERVLAAMRAVPRERFVSPVYAASAYDDGPIPIDCGQTVSQPYVVALMAEALELSPGDRVLEVGTGSGYASAVLSHLAREVYTVERHGKLAESARERLASLGYANVHVLHGDGLQGWPEHAPYDAISVAAGGPEVPPALSAQLAPGGRLVMPLGPETYLQKLVRARPRRNGAGLDLEDLADVRFVPLLPEAVPD
jgi:protein-L-isoaspartate(D-aspartate) O-methyltransferase